ncbi:SGNH/GDSL hydrolase family protein [Amycolatopsis minnesotensis]|uniref:SGNH/GDSL hydrolase family protein n=1 Tax=Amycolatopsis minnesotensis TaxID=337894 RepID=A0ABP5D5V6_9PSEU
MTVPAPPRPRRARLARAAAVTGTALAMIGLGTPATAAPARQVYVAMGDSFAAGALVLPQSDLFTCARSAVDYAQLLSKKIKPAATRDVTCSSATTEDFGKPQPGNVFGTAKPQYDALSRDTTLVTVQIGGNDIGLVGLATSCVNLLPQTGIIDAPLLGKSCKATSTEGGVDRYARRIDAFAPTYGTVIEQIRHRAPKARILMVGYPTGIQPGGCWPFVPVLPQDADYVQGNIDRLNTRMAEQAARHGATYVDIRTPSIGHDACQGIGTKWIEGVLPTVIDNGIAPLHPNAAGLAAVVPRLEAALRTPSLQDSRA